MRNLPQSFYFVALIRLDGTWVFIESYRPPLMSWWNARCGTDGTVHMIGVDYVSVLQIGHKMQGWEPPKTLGILEFQFFFLKRKP